MTEHSAEAPVMYPTCGSCRHWDQESRKVPTLYLDDEPYEEPIPGGWGGCERIIHRRHETDEEGEVAFLSDGSGYYAALTTKAEFGCQLWEARKGAASDRAD